MPSPIRRRDLLIAGAASAALVGMLVAEAFGGQPARRS